MTYVITTNCIDIKDGGCVDVCPVDCIYEGPRMYYIHPDECINCGICESVCPVEAIYYEDDLSPELARYVKINEEFFAESITGLDSPQGALHVGASSIDHPYVAAQPLVIAET